MDDSATPRRRRRQRAAGRRGVPGACGAAAGVSAYTPHTAADVAAMLETIGVSSLDDLLAHVPASLRAAAGIELAPGLNEPDLRRAMERLAQQDELIPDDAVFLGAGAYPHVAPSVVGHVLLRSE